MNINYGEKGCRERNAAARLGKRAVRQLGRFGNRGMEGLSEIIVRIASFEQKIRNSHLHPGKKAHALVALFLARNLVEKQEKHNVAGTRQETRAKGSIYQDGSQWFDRCGNIRYPE
ncbi:hypothetical protein GF415_00785 [Candidatus Micrarchaeota archaeon]|nr:hypothetical protein [Candidatus Micrarchaeota archaeon]